GGFHPLGLFPGLQAARQLLALPVQHLDALVGLHAAVPAVDPDDKAALLGLDLPDGARRLESTQAPDQQDDEARSDSPPTQHGILLSGVRSRSGLKRNLPGHLRQQVFLLSGGETAPLGAGWPCRPAASPAHRVAFPSSSSSVRRSHPIRYVVGTDLWSTSWIVPAQPPSGMSGKSGSVVPGFTRTCAPGANRAGVRAFFSCVAWLAFFLL